MPITGFWGNPSRTYIVFELQPPWTWPDFVQGTRQTLDLLKEAPEPLPMVILAQLKSVSDVPPGPAAQVYTDTLVAFAPYVTTYVLVGGSLHGNMLLQSLNNTHSKLKGKFRFTDTIAEALTLLNIPKTVSRADKFEGEEPHISV